MAFSFPAFSYIIALIVDAFLIFFSIFHVIAFDELKTDYKNPIDQCNSLNPLVLPEYLLHLIINLLFLLSGEWFSLLINVPLILYHIHRYRNRPVMSGPGLYDPTSIMNADVLTVCQREGWIKLAFYLLSFFLYLYGMIVVLIATVSALLPGRPLDMRVAFAIIYGAIFAFSNHAHSARILGLFPHTGRSHHMVYDPLLRKLAERGHDVTVGSFFPLKNPPANYHDISFEGIADVGLENFDLNSFNSSVLYKIPKIGNLMQILADLNILADMGVSTCSKLINLPSLNEALKKKYDVVLMENFSSDCMFGLLHVYDIKAPIIGLSSCMLMPWSAERLGASDNTAYVPVGTTPFTPSMTFLQRMENTFWRVYAKLWFRYSVQNKEQALIEKRFGKKIPEFANLGRNVSLMLVNTFHALNGATPLVPGIVEVGGMHLNETKKDVPQYIERFLNESEHGVILLSFGSLIKTASIPKYKEEIIVNALSKFKQQIIWKYEESAEEGTLTGNILRVRWLPQYELLQHEKIIAFIAHGGLLGMTEAVSAGKPMVVVPFFGDQPANAAAAAAAGFAKVLSYNDLSEESLTDAVQSVLSAEMRLNARRISKIWKDRESSPLDTAVFWTERVIRWGHAAPLHTAARELAFYELALLDVAAAYILALLVLVTIIWYLLSKISQLFVKEPKQKMH
ncbi:UDP-glycosyltransferase UGT5-like [Maniola hyperantus]|uniref:UDP-glycosyltransferase UGT5-like n=1 Tax=Aphantopus hyperantus TaxID=2795564 RepID=UPI00374A8FA7